MSHNYLGLGEIPTKNLFAFGSSTVTFFDRKLRNSELRRSLRNAC